MMTLKVLHDYINTLPPPLPTWPIEVSSAIVFIHQHLYDYRLNIEYILEECRISGSNFSGQFAHYVGVTPKKYILNHRLRSAELILSNQSVVSTALCVGFKSHSAFTMAYKKKNGHSPCTSKANQKLMLIEITDNSFIK